MNMGHSLLLVGVGWGELEGGGEAHAVERVAASDALEPDDGRVAAEQQGVAGGLGAVDLAQVREDLGEVPAG